MKTPKAIGEYLLQRLHENGVGHVFGIPGDYALGFCDQIIASAGRGHLVRTEEELEAGLRAAEADTDQLQLLDVQLAPLDQSAALQRLAQRMGRLV